MSIVFFKNYTCLLNKYSKILLKTIRGKPVKLGMLLLCAKLLLLFIVVFFHKTMLNDSIRNMIRLYT